MSCPKPHVLSAYALRLVGVPLGGPEEDSGATDLELHLEGCAACQRVVAQDQRLVEAFETLVCPEPETLAAFLEEALPAERLEALAGHVLACPPCQEVVTWTREAEQSLRQGGSAASRSHSRATSRKTLKQSGRARARKRGTRARQDSPFLPGVLAAAAALLLGALGLGLLSSPSTQGPSTARKTDSAETTRERVSRERVSQAKTEVKTGSSKTHSEAAPTVKTSDPKTEEPTQTRLEPKPTAEPGVKPGEPKSTPRPVPAVKPVPKPAAKQVQVAALPGSALRYQVPGGRSASLPAGQSKALPLGTRLSTAAGAGFRVPGGSVCLLSGPSVLALAAPSATGSLALMLHKGAVEVDAASGGPELVRGQLRVQVGAKGGRFVGELKAGNFLVCVVTGSAKVHAQAGSMELMAGQAAAFRAGKLRRAPAAAPLSRARSQARRAVEAQGVDAPLGVHVWAALEGLRTRKAEASLAQRAQDQLLIQATLAAGPRFARLAPASTADAALAALAKEDDLPAAALPSLCLALLAQGRRTRKLDLAALRPHAARLAARPADELVQDSQALLALRALSRLKRSRLKLPRGLWKSLAGALRAAGPASSPEVLARALLVRPQRLLESKLLDAALAGDPDTAPLSAERLQAIHRASLLSGLRDPVRRSLELAHAGRIKAESSHALALLALDHSAAALGLRPALLAGPGAAGLRGQKPASVVALRTPRGWRVRFRWTPGARQRARVVHLCGSWDRWKETATPMTRTKEGAFEVLLDLPPGRYEYKLRLDDDRVWIVDPGTPLVADDTRGGQNSVVYLPR